MGQAVISRFHTTKYAREILLDDGGVASDGNLWKYWSPEVNDVAERQEASKL
jgi:hypothetical protein